MRTETLLVISVLVLCFATVSGLVKRYCIAPALIFVLIGVALGPTGSSSSRFGPTGKTS